MKEKHLFAGVNSPKGFFSYFDSIMEEVPGGRKIYIKGGPGMGKSTLMKKVVKRAADEDLACEVFHCSSDPSSVDGVYIPALKTAIMDATAPHNADPVFPCVGGEYFDVSKYADREILYKKAGSILEYTKAKKLSFQKGYSFLKSALPLLKQIENEYMENTDKRAIYFEAEKLARRIFGNHTEREAGKIRPLFLSAITPEGFVNFADVFFADTLCFAVKGDFGASLFFKYISKLAVMHGYSIVVFYCPMQPTEKIEHIYIPKLQVSITSYNFYTHCAAAETIELDEFSFLSKGNGEAFSLSGMLIQRAIDAFAEAKNTHALLEQIYIPSMDFDGLDKQGERLLNSIF